MRRATNHPMRRRGSRLLVAAASAVLPTLHAEALAPDTMIRQLSTDVIDSVKADKAIQGGDISRINALVDAKVMPVVDFQRMTASAVGRYWRTATPDQKKRLQDEFKTLLVRTYAGALSQVRDQTVALKPLRAAPTDTEVVVRTEIRGRGDPIQLDYRLEKDGDSWRIYDVNVLGVMNVTAACLPYMREGSGVVNFASVDAFTVSPGQLVYGASKAAVVMLTKELALELAPQRIRVNGIAPAAIDTPMFAQMTQAHIDYMLGKIPMGRFLEVEELAAMVAWLSSEECSFSTGAVFDLSGGRATY